MTTIGRYAIGISAAVALAGFAAVARAAQPAAAHRVPTARTSFTTASTTFFGDAGSNIGPAGSAEPQIQTGAS